MLKFAISDLRISKNLPVIPQFADNLVSCYFYWEILADNYYFRVLFPSQVGNNNLVITNPLFFDVLSMSPPPPPPEAEQCKHTLAPTQLVTCLD